MLISHFSHNLKDHQNYKRKSKKYLQTLIASSQYLQKMGGNAFEDTQKLTPQEYTAILSKIKNLLQPICLIIQPYIPLPQKQSHGDIDFLLILKNGYQLKDIQDTLQIPKENFIINNNSTVNSLYYKKQVDFNVVKDKHEFQLCSFYKSYGGLGAFLGLFLPSKFVKFSEDGLFCSAYQQHIKLQYLVCDNIRQILQFYGLNSQQYQKGFNTRIQLFEYLRNMRFLDENKFISHTTKHQTKLMKAFQEYLLLKGPRINQNYTLLKNPCQYTLDYFKKIDKFNIEWQNKLQQESKRKKRHQKWNGSHIMNLFQVSSKNVKGYKQKFQSFFQDQTQFQNYIDKTPFNQIVKKFSEISQLQCLSNMKF